MAELAVIEGGKSPAVQPHEATVDELCERYDEYDEQAQNFKTARALVLSVLRARMLREKRFSLPSEIWTIKAVPRVFIGCVTHRLEPGDCPCALDEIVLGKIELADLDERWISIRRKEKKVAPKVCALELVKDEEQ